MRVARRRPMPVGLPLPALLVGLAAIALAGLIALRVNPFDPPSAARPATIGATGMAATFGLDGLTGLAAPNNDGAPLPSPAERNQIVAYYGAPQTPSMGVLGQVPPEDAAALLAERAARFRFVSRSWDVLPALHLVYAVAQPDTGAGSLRYLDDRTVRQFISLARRNGFVTILDLQIGHSDALAEVQRITPYLREPDVFVALDPEFALPEATRPGEKIGSIDASAINDVEAYLAQLVAEQHLPAKMLIVHQFEAYMITNTTAIERHPGVDLVIDMDGYGPADIKDAKYVRYAGSAYAPFGGIKIFLQHDPDPLTESEVLALQPRPALIVYQ